MRPTCCQRSSFATPASLTRSSKSAFNIAKPFLWLAKRLSNGADSPSSTRPLVHPQADRFRRCPSSHLAVQHSVLHGVISQVIRPDVAAFMEGKRVVARTHQDELRCVNKVKFIAGGPVREADIEYLEQFPHLVGLDCEETAIAAELELVARLSRLEFLDLTSCCVDVDALADLGRLSQLQHLSLIYCDGIDAAVLTSIGTLTTLQHLDLRECDGVDAAGLAEVSMLTNLQHLDLSYCHVDAAGLAEVGKLTTLRHLDLSWCDGVNAAGLAEVGKLTTLRHLDLSYCHGVDAAGLAEVGKLYHLRHLDLSYCVVVNAVGLVFVEKLEHLQYLNLKRCFVDEADLAVLQRNCPNVVC